jgi:hypothetical protein
MWKNKEKNDTYMQKDIRINELVIKYKSHGKIKTGTLRKNVEFSWIRNRFLIIMHEVEEEYGKVMNIRVA